ncbi:MAG: HEAT repeat domain-containing protein [Deltaproteobacteria bacterium]|nr:HEAT repeat domain-containing protein [Deltaproteobacteria bacterium]
MPQYGWPPKPIPHVTAALRDAGSARASFRRNAAIALRKAEDDQRGHAIEALAKLLEDADRTVRIEAARSASALGAGELSESVSPLLESPDPDLRIAAMEFSASTDSSGDVERVRGILEKDEDAVVRCVALETLSALDPAETRSACRTILSSPDENVPVLRTAMVLLRSDGDREDAGLFHGILGDPRPGVSLEAAASLAHLEDERAVPRLLDEALHPSNADERFIALEGLCRTSDENVHDAARRKLGSLLTGRWEKLLWAGILASTGDMEALEWVRGQVVGRDAKRAAAAMRVAGLCSLVSLVDMLASTARDGLDGDEDALYVEAIEALGLMRTSAAAAALEPIADRSGDELARAALEEVKRWTRS